MPKVLLYHDVVEDDDASGFLGGGAAQYKLRPGEFNSHLNAIAAAKVRPVTIASLQEPGGEMHSDALLITFDDGGVSAVTPVADDLERLGWQGHFFITVDRIGAPGFVSAVQIRELDHRGHVIGSHSCSHPVRMAACSRAQLMEEWTRSREVLSNILGKPVTAASVPGGYYSRLVAETAAQSGLGHLFTSEPTKRTWHVQGCRVYGRYTIYRGMAPSAAAGIAAGSPIPMLQQAASWKIKKILKTVGGRAYLGLRQFALDQKHGSPT